MLFFLPIGESSARGTIRPFPRHPRHPRPNFEPGCQPYPREAKCKRPSANLDNRVLSDHEDAIAGGGTDLRDAGEVAERRQDADVGA